jgi:hypothetical protein
MRKTVTFLLTCLTIIQGAFQAYIYTTILCLEQSIYDFILTYILMLIWVLGLSSSARNTIPTTTPRQGASDGLWCIRPTPPRNLSLLLTSQITHLNTDSTRKRIHRILEDPGGYMVTDSHSSAERRISLETCGCPEYGFSYLRGGAVGSAG